MKALIVENAYIQNKSQISQAERIAQEFTALGVGADVVKNFNLARIDGGKIKAADYSFCVFLDKDRVAARLLEGAGLRLFNTARAIEDCDDKMLTSIALANAAIPVPDCMYAPLCYYSGQPYNDSFLSEVVSSLGLPLVAKTNYGSLGAGVKLIKSFEELKNFEVQNMLLPHFYQRMIGSGGEDVRVIVIGGEVACAMKRSNSRDFRSNIELGGTGERVELSKELSRLCQKTASALKLDYCGIDVLHDSDGKAYVCEVNSNAFFATAERVCGVNVAKAYAEYIIKNMS